MSKPITRTGTAAVTATRVSRSPNELSGRPRCHCQARWPPSRAVYTASLPRSRAGAGSGIASWVKSGEIRQTTTPIPTIPTSSVSQPHAPSGRPVFAAKSRITTGRSRATSAASRHVGVRRSCRCSNVPRPAFSAARATRGGGTASVDIPSSSITGSRQGKGCRTPPAPLVRTVTASPRRARAMVAAPRPRALLGVSARAGETRVGRAHGRAGHRAAIRHGLLTRVATDLSEDPVMATLRDRLTHVAACRGACRIGGISCHHALRLGDRASPGEKRSAPSATERHGLPG